MGPEGYRLVLPDGWVRLNVQDDVDATVAEALAQSGLDAFPRDERSRRRAAAEGRLRSAIAQARKVDAYALYLPIKGMHGVAVPASFVVAEATEFSGGGPIEDVLDQLLRAPKTHRALLDGADAVRSEAVVEGMDDESGRTVPARQIVYTMAVPDSPQWLIVVFDVLLGDGSDREYDSFVDALVLLFDAIMTTFRWQFATP